MNEVESYILGLDGHQKAIISFLHRHLKTYHELVPRIQWRIPTYHRKRLVCYLNPIENEGIELAFVKGSLLSNEQGILLRKGRKLVAGVELFEAKEIDQVLLDQIIHEALILDDLSN